MGAEVDWDTTTVILQLFDNIIYMVGGPGGEKKPPSKDKHRVYHIDSNLIVADKQAIKSLVNVLTTLFEAAGECPQAFPYAAGDVLDVTLLQ